MKKFLFLLVAMCSFSIAAQSTYLHCGKLIDTKTGQVLSNKTIIVSGKKITAIEDGFVSPKNTEDSVINLKDKTVMPGLIDMHVHIGGEAQGASPEYVFKLWMAHGVTTVRQVSGRNAIELKRQSAAHEIIAPRIFEYTGFGSGSSKPISTPEMAREWVRQNAKNGADGIKFFGAEPDIMTAALDENKKLEKFKKSL